MRLLDLCGENGAFRNWKRTKDTADEKKYKELSNKCDKMIKAAKVSSFKKASASGCRRNSKPIWRFVKKSATSSSIPSIKVPGEVDKYILHPQEKAENINTVFNAQYKPCRDHCHSTETIPPNTLSSFSQLHVTCRHGRKMLRKINCTKSSASSLLTNTLLKAAGSYISYPLCIVFNLST